MRMLYFGRIRAGLPGFSGLIAFHEVGGHAVNLESSIAARVEMHILKVRGCLLNSFGYLRAGEHFFNSCSLSSTHISTLSLDLERRYCCKSQAGSISKRTSAPLFPSLHELGSPP